MRLTLLIAALAVVAASCGGGNDSSAGVASLENPATDLAAGDIEAGGDTTADTAPVSEEEALLAFTQCLRDQGIEVGDPTVDADGNLRLTPPDEGGGERDGPGRFGDEDGRAAFQECSALLEGVTLGFRDRDQTEFQDRLVEFAACMRDNGYDMPDPDFSDFGPGAGGPFGGVDPDDPAFAAAQEACADLLGGLPGRGPGPGGGPTGE